MVEIYLPDYYKSFNVKYIDSANITKYNALGKPIFMPVKLDGVDLPEAPIVTIQPGILVEKTTLAGGEFKGSVKQGIGLDDYIITIRGWVKSDDNNYPEEKVRMIKDLILQKKSLSIDCLITKLFEIYKVVVYGRPSFPEVKAQNVQFYEFECLSDEDFVLDYNDEITSPNNGILFPVTTVSTKK